jgi:defect-in-organelle-trafficking protein DotC
MRLFPAIKAAASVCCVALAIAAAPAHAQTANTQPRVMSPQQAQAYAQTLSQMLQQQSGGGGAGTIGQPGGAPGALPFGMTPEKPVMTQKELNAELADRDSAQAKADRLADKAKESNKLFGLPRQVKEPNPLDEMPTPPTLEKLQNVNEAEGQNISDDLITKKMSIDMRRDSQREAALSYGARGGLAKRAFEVLEEMKAYEATLDKVFNFRALLVRAPSGLLIEPPIVRESLDATVITEGGSEAAVADQILKINKQAKIVTAPRDWRQYLEMRYDTIIAPPPKILWPKNAKEQASWNAWVKQGWKEGYEQGEQIFEANLAQMVADYSGMVRYRMLLAEGKISQPYALQEDRGVTGGRNEMRVGDRALRITGPSQFLTGADLWKPADR